MWLENRLHVDVFSGEFENVLRVLELLPGVGTPYPEADGIAGVVGKRRRRSGSRIVQPSPCLLGWS